VTPFLPHDRTSRFQARGQFQIRPQLPVSPRRSSGRLGILAAEDALLEGGAIVFVVDFDVDDR